MNISEDEWNLNGSVIMGNNDKNDRQFNGLLDELRIYTEKLDK